MEYLAIIYPVAGQCFPSAEGVVLSMALAPHVYSRWPRDKDAGELCFALQQGRVCEDAACVAPGPCSDSHCGGGHEQKDAAPWNIQYFKR